MNIIIDFFCKPSVKYYRALIKESSRDLRVQLLAKSALRKTHHNTFEMIAMKKTRDCFFFLIPTKLFFDSFFENNNKKKTFVSFSAHLDADTPESKQSNDNF